MAKGSTFPADDVPDRTGLILGVLRAHDPVPVPTTALYLAIEDKRALADAFARIAASGEMEATVLTPEDPHFDAAADLAGLGRAARVAPLAAYRLGPAARTREDG